MHGETIAWVAFNVSVAILLVLDLAVFHRKSHTIGLREALFGCACWVTLALAFNGVILWWRGRQPALEFFTGYLIEYSLSMDNLFVFLLLFRYFAVPAQYQHRLLFWGIIGAVVMRAAFILGGFALLHYVHAVIYLFGAFLVYSGIRMAVEREPAVNPEKSPAIKLFRRLFPVTKRYHGDRFWVRGHGRWMATPLLLALVAVDVADVIFAVDSIPAIIAITHDPFIAYSSNVLAVLGLRALYFAIAGVLRIFHGLHYGMSAILVFIGAKMLISKWVEVPVGVSLGIVAGLLALSIALSLAFPQKGTMPAVEEEGEKATDSNAPSE